MNRYTEKLLRGAEKFQSNKYVKALSGGMMGVMALMMISSVATLIGAIDFWGIQEFLVKTGIKGVTNQIVTMSNGIVAIYVAFMVAYKMGEVFKSDELNCGIMGIMAFNPSKGMTVNIEANGEDEQEALVAMEKFLVCE